MVTFLQTDRNDKRNVGPRNRGRISTHGYLQKLARIAAAIIVLLAILPFPGMAATSKEPVRTTNGGSLAASILEDDERFFPETGFRVNDDRFFDYFNKRGGIDTFGLPVSRQFTLLGTQVQFFQRRIMQLQPDGSVGLLNVLDPELMPYNVMNGATFPLYDPVLTASAPQPGSPGYDRTIIDFVRVNAPETFEGQPVKFYTTFLNTVSLDEAFPAGGGDPNSLPGVDLEMWGVPTSKPARDPNNGTFIYLRFQRGVMHYDSTIGLTQGLLIADFFKSIITGENLPPDLNGQSRGSRFYLQYNNALPNGLNRPNELPATDMHDAFLREAPKPVPPPPLTGINGLRYGMQVQMFGQPQNRLIDSIYTCGFRWLKQQVRWSEFEPVQGQIVFGPLDELVNAANARGTALMFSIVSSPKWSRADGRTNGPPDDFQNFGNFVAALATRYQGKVVAYEIWNEQNMAAEWAGRPLAPGDYVELLKIAYTRIKQVDPAAIVVSGALTPTGVNGGVIAIDDVAYLQGMYSYQGGTFMGSMDVLGIHASGYNNAPQDFVNFHTVNTAGYKNHPSFYFRRIDQLREVMVQNGDFGRQAWLTELTWGAATPPVPAGYEWTTQLSDQQVGSFYVQAIQMIQRDRPWVGGIYIWNLNFRVFLNFHTSEQAIFGILNSDYSPRIIYTSLRLMPK